MNEFLYNLALVLGHTQLLEHKGDEPLGEAWAVNTGSVMGALLRSEPDVPQFKPVDTTKEQLAAVRGNIANFADVSKLAGSTNQFNQEQLNKMMESALPGYKAMVANIGGKIGSFLSGELPADVSSSIGRNAAYKSLSGGYGGSGMARNLVARDLGMTSLDLISKGIDAGSRWIATAKANTVAPQFDVSSMFITPQQRIQTQMWNTEQQWNRDWLKNQVDAAYSSESAWANLFDNIEETGQSVLSSYAGNAMGGGGGGGGGGAGGGI